MKIILFGAMALLIVLSNVKAETVMLTNSNFAITTVAIVKNPLLAQKNVYFSKSGLGATCGLFMTTSALAQSTVKVIKNPLFAKYTVNQLNSAIGATDIVYLVKSPLTAFGHCDYAAALLPK